MAYELSKNLSFFYPAGIFDPGTKTTFQINSTYTFESSGDAVLLRFVSPVTQSSGILTLRIYVDLIGGSSFGIFSEIEVRNGAGVGDDPDRPESGGSELGSSGFPVGVFGSVWHLFNNTTSLSLTKGQTYWIVIHGGDPTDNYSPVIRSSLDWENESSIGDMFRSFITTDGISSDPSAQIGVAPFVIKFDDGTILGFPYINKLTVTSNTNFRGTRFKFDHDVVISGAFVEGLPDASVGSTIALYDTSGNVLDSGGATDTLDEAQGFDNGLARWSPVPIAAGTEFIAAWHPDASSSIGPYNMGLGTIPADVLAAAVDNCGGVNASTAAGLNATFNAEELFPISLVIDDFPVSAPTGAMVGTTSIVFTTTTNALTATGSLVGTTSIVFSDTALLLGIAPIFAEETIVFSDTAVGRAIGSLVATESLDFGFTAVLAGEGQLVGTTSILFTATGKLKENLRGNEPITFITTSVLTGKGNVIANEPVAFLDTAFLGHRVAITGTESITFAVSKAILLDQPGAGADVWYKTGTFNTPASGSTVLGSLPGTAPKFIHLWWSNATTDNTVQAHQQFGHGMSDGVDHDCLTVTAQDGVNLNERDSRNVNCILISNPASVGTDVVLATTATMNTNDVTIAYTTFTAGHIINYEIWGGVGVSVNMLQYGSAVANSPLTHGLGSKPDLLMVCTIGTGHPGSSIHSYLSFGVAHDNGASIDQWNLHSFFGDSDIDFVGSALTSGDIVGQFDSDFADWDSTITAISTTTFTWTETAAPGADQNLVAVLNFQGDGVVGVDVGTFAKSTSAAPVTQAMPDFGFTPTGYALATANLDSLTKPGTNTNRIAHVSFGAYDGTDGIVATTVGTPSSNADRASISVDGEVLQGSVALQASGVQFSGTPQAITDSTPDIEWNPNTTGGTDDVFIGYYGIELQVTDVLTATVPIATDNQIIQIYQSPTATMQATGALVGTTSILFTDTATVVVPPDTGAMIGTTSLLFSETGIITGTGALVGTTSIVITPTSVLTAIGTLVASETITLTPTSVLAGTGSLVGATSILFTTALVPHLYGSVSLDFGFTSVLAGTGSIISSEAITFTPTSVLTAIGTLVGSTSLAITETGVVTGTGGLVATETIVFSDTVVISAKGSLVGTETILITPTSVLAGAGQLVGSTSIVFSDTAVIRAIGPLDASEPITFTETGIIQATGSLVGATSIVFSETLVPHLYSSVSLGFGFNAILAGEGQLVGTETITITPTSVLTGKGQLVGTTSLTITPTSVLIADGQLVGSTSLVFSDTATVVQGAIEAVEPITFITTSVLTGKGSLVSSVSLIFSNVATVLQTPEHDQASFRMYADGTESGAVALVDQNTAITIAKETIFHVRVGTQISNDPDGVTVTYEYREEDDPDSEYRSIG